MDVRRPGAPSPTSEVAACLAALSRSLDADGHPPHRVAAFLMRLVLTMFAEDACLLSERALTAGLERRWIRSPRRFCGGVEEIFRALRDGAAPGLDDLLQRSLLFREPTALPLSPGALRLLLDTARCAIRDVEPSIFGVLFERALDPAERRELGAHFTPRAHVERLVCPTLEDPLREAWTRARADARRRAAIGDARGAAAAISAFHDGLCGVRVLDPACGSGNFLYVALDVLKRLEHEALTMLNEIEGRANAESRPTSSDGSVSAPPRTVGPAQLLGIEIKPWATEIAEVVLRIAHLQSHARAYGRGALPPAPALHDCARIERRDALLAWDGDRPRPAPWPDADYILGNPPFLGDKRMRAVLGDRRVDALRRAHPDVPEAADYVMYWWSRAAALVRAGRARRFGLITTNSITQGFNRRVVEAHLARGGLHLAFAIPDHPWVDASEGVAVRIAMTVGAPGEADGTLAHVAQQGPAAILREDRGRIRPALTLGADVTAAAKLRSNRGLACAGVQLSGQGFLIDPPSLARFSPRTRRDLIRPYLLGQDLLHRPRERYVIDATGLTLEQLCDRYPDAHQWLKAHVHPERRNNPREAYRRAWWIFSEPRRRFRAAAAGLRSTIAVCRTAKHRVYTLVPADAVAETTVIRFALEAPWLLGVLSSRIHEAWILAAGGTLEDRPRYNASYCFDPFPFPACADPARRRVAAIAQRIEDHRRDRSAEHPDLTMTAVYNVLARLRAARALSPADLAIHDRARLPILRDLHDALDEAVLDAYGWPRDLAAERIVARLLDLNAERADEERRGVVRWLRAAP